jgi:ABC-type transport system substrate-binding protein
LTFTYFYFQSWYLDEANWLYDVFHSRGVFNYTGYTNPEVDAIMEEALGTADPLQRPRLWNQAHEMILLDAPVVPVAHPRRAAFVRPGLSTIVFGPMDGAFPGSLSLRGEPEE